MHKIVSITKEDIALTYINSPETYPHFNHDNYMPKLTPTLNPLVLSKKL